MSSNVVGLNARPFANNTEFQELTKVLAVVNWAINVSTVVDTMGLPLSDVLENQNTAIPANTKAANFGHSTVGSFITSGPEKLGLNKPWDEWVKQVKALRLKKMYEIHSESFNDIIDQFNDVTKSFGRTPVNASEYHHAKDAILKKQRTESDRRYQMQAGEMQERIADLMKSLETEQRNSQSQKVKTIELENQLETALQEMNHKLAEAQRNHDTDLERKLVAQRNELLSTTQQQLEEMRVSSEMRVREAHERLQQMQDYYEQNFISKADHEIVKQQLERERQINFDTLRQLNETNLSLNNAMEKLESEQMALSAERENVAALNTQIEQLSNRMNTIALAPFVGQSSELVAELQQQIDTLSARLNESTTQNADLTNKQKLLRRKLEELLGQVSTLTDQNKALTSRLKKLKLKLKLKTNQVVSNKSTLITLGTLLGLSLVTTVCLIATA